MKRVIEVSALFCIVAVGAGCPILSDSCDPTQNLTGQVDFGDSITNQVDCEAANGVWGSHGIPDASCNIRAGDTGKECCDSSQCEGSCIECADAMCTVGTCSDFRIVLDCVRRWHNGVLDEFASCP